MHDKRVLIRELAEGMHSLYERVNGSLLTSSMQAGHMPHPVFYGFVLPAGGVASYFRNVAQVVDNPEVGKKYGFDPIGMLRARRATKAAESALQALPLEQLQEVYRGVKQVLEQDVESGVSIWVDAQEKRAGQKMTDEERVKMQPVIQAMEVIETTQRLQEIYKPF